MHEAEAIKEVLLSQQNRLLKRRQVRCEANVHVMQSKNARALAPDPHRGADRMPVRVATKASKRDPRRTLDGRSPGGVAHKLQRCEDHHGPGVDDPGQGKREAFARTKVERDLEPWSTNEWTLRVDPLGEGTHLRESAQDHVALRGDSIVEGPEVCVMIYEFSSSADRNELTAETGRLVRMRARPCQNGIRVATFLLSRFRAFGIVKAAQSFERSNAPLALGAVVLLRRAFPLTFALRSRKSGFERCHAIGEGHPHRVDDLANDARDQGVLRVCATLEIGLADVV